MLMSANSDMSMLISAKWTQTDYSYLDNSQGILTVLLKGHNTSSVSQSKQFQKNPWIKQLKHFACILFMWELQ